MVYESAVVLIENEKKNADLKKNGAVSVEDDVCLTSIIIPIQFYYIR